MGRKINTTISCSGTHICILSTTFISPLSDGWFSCILSGIPKEVPLDDWQSRKTFRTFRYKLPRWNKSAENFEWAPCSSLYISGHPEKKTFAMEQVFRWTIGKRYCWPRRGTYENRKWGVTKHTIVQNEGVDFILILKHKFLYDFLSSLKRRPQINPCFRKLQSGKWLLPSVVNNCNK